MCGAAYNMRGTTIRGSMTSRLGGVYWLFNEQHMAVEYRLLELRCQTSSRREFVTVHCQISLQNLRGVVEVVVD